MDYYNKLKTMFEMESIAEKRNIQLKQEAIIDDTLKTCYKKCPEEIFKYTMNMRNMNRVNSDDMYKSGYIDYPEKMNKACNDVDRIQKFFEGNDDCNHICNTLLPLINPTIEQNKK